MAEIESRTIAPMAPSTSLGNTSPGMKRKAEDGEYEVMSLLPAAHSIIEQR